MGELLTRWTIRIALLLCAGSIALSLRSRQPGIPTDRRAAFVFQVRLLWTLAFACYLLHVAAAFQFYHAWSHWAAWNHTADRTDEVLGIPWGGGIWFNYLFTFAWGAEVAWSWFRTASYASMPVYARWVWGVWFLMMVFFAAIVFESGWTRWVSVFFLTLLAIGTIRLAQNSHSTGSMD